MIVASNARCSAKALTFLVAAPAVFISFMLLASSAHAAPAAVAQCGKKPGAEDRAMLEKWLACERRADLAELSRIARCKSPIRSPDQAEVLRCLGKPDAVDAVRGSDGTKAWAYPELGAWIYIKDGTVTSVKWLGDRS